MTRDGGDGGKGGRGGRREGGGSGRILWIARPKRSDPQTQERPTASTRTIYKIISKVLGTSPVEGNYHNCVRLRNLFLQQL